MDLFDITPSAPGSRTAPLAYRMRPRNLDEVAGQQHLVGKGAVLRRLIEQDQLHSFILYGPPGTGKTSLARIIAGITHSYFVPLQAVTAGVGDIRKIAADASQRLKYYGQKTILFVDEIHRFNKSQQDVLLPFVEDGTLLLIGSTTENPLYELNNSLLSRAKLYILNSLEETDITRIIREAIHDAERGLGNFHIEIDNEGLEFIAVNSKGDARMALNILEATVNSFMQDNRLVINQTLLERIVDRPLIKYDKTGDRHYDSISAFIKSIRGSDPDAALFWLAVMLEGGEDPLYVARRLVVHAAEDIGLADPSALILAQATADAVHLLGMPEARIPLAEAALYLATAPKSNSSKLAIDMALAAVRNSKKITVPAHIADTSHSRAGELLGKGCGYKYPHDYGGFVEQEYLPAELSGTKFYHPLGNGYEKDIRQYLHKIKKPPG